MRLTACSEPSSENVVPSRGLVLVTMRGLDEAIRASSPARPGRFLDGLDPAAWSSAPPASRWLSRWAIGGIVLQAGDTRPQGLPSTFIDRGKRQEQAGRRAAWLSTDGSDGADTILGHEAGRVGIAGGNAGGGHRFAGRFAPGDFQVEREQLSQDVFLGREAVGGQNGGVESA